MELFLAFEEKFRTINNMSDEQIYAKFYILDELPIEILNFEQFTTFAKFIDERIMPIILEREEDFSDTFSFTFGCYADLLKEAQEDRLKSGKIEFKSEWGLAANCLITALCNTG